MHSAFFFFPPLQLFSGEINPECFFLFLLLTERISPLWTLLGCAHSASYSHVHSSAGAAFKYRFTASLSETPAFCQLLQERLKVWFVLSTVICISPAALLIVGHLF